VEVEAALANTVTGELAGIGCQRGQFDLLEAGGNVQTLQWIEWRQLALDTDGRVAIHLALDVDRRRRLPLIVQRADPSVELLDRRGEGRAQAEVGEVGQPVGDGDFADV